MSEKRAISETLVQAYEVASWERCTIPHDTELEAINEQLKQTPYDGALWLKKGHILSEMYMMREAEEAYAMAIVSDPLNWEYFRFRGHRFISCWRFADATADLSVASRLNEKDRDTWYHLGLCFFFLRDYARAEDAFAKCLALTETDYKTVSVIDWYWMTLKRLGKDAEAQKLVDDYVRLDMEAGGHQEYYSRLLLYKGVKKPEDLLHLGDPDYPASDQITSGFGVANYYDTIGEHDKCLNVLRKIVEIGDAQNGYFAFAYMAAKLDLRDRMA